MGYSLRLHLPSKVKERFLDTNVGLCTRLHKTNLQLLSQRLTLFFADHLILILRILVHIINIRGW